MTGLKRRFWTSGRWRGAALAAVASVALSGCATYPYSPPALPPVTAAAPVAAMTEAREPVTILIGVDGLRPDYLDRGVTPVLSRLAREGASGPMRPSFPSKTFPNFWTLVTGLRPDRHGLVANRMEDPARPGETFTMATDDPFWWNAAEPIWVTAERAGVPTAVGSWPGGNVAWGGARAAEWPHKLTGGLRPRDWHGYAGAQTGEQRVRSIVDWLRRPVGERPRFLTLYFDVVDTVGHEHGPEDPRTTAAVAQVDATIGGLVDSLRALGQPANLVIVADHGMVATSSERTIALDRILPATDARTIETGPYATFVPLPGREAEVAGALLRPHPHMICWRKAQIPARLHYGRNPRVPPFLCLAEPGWEIVRTAPMRADVGGEHGYDPAAPSMQALFLAHGPAFRAGVRVSAFDNVAVAPLLRDLLGLPAGAGLDGDTRPFRRALKGR